MVHFSCSGKGYLVIYPPFLSGISFNNCTGLIPETIAFAIHLVFIFNEIFDIFVIGNNIESLRNTP